MRANPKLLFINAIVFLFIFVFVLMFPLMHDDLVWSNINALANHTVVSHIVGDYFHWTGRISQQILAYTLFNRSFNFITVPIMATVTAFCFVLLVRVSYHVIFMEQPSDHHLNRYMILALLIVLYVKNIHSFVEMIGFKAVTVQYFWAMVIAGWLLLKFSTQTQLDRISLLQSTLFFLLGLLFGLCSELIVPCVLFYFLMTLHCSLRNRRVVAYASGLLIGFVALIAAPGNYVRKAQAMVDTHTANVHYSLFEKIKILLSLYAQQAHFKIECGIVVVLLLILAFILKQRTGYPVKLVLGAIFSLLILTPVAYYYNGVIRGRVTFISDMLLFYALVYLVVLNFRALLPRWKWPSVHWRLLCSLMTFYFMIFIYAGYPAYCFNKARIALIKDTPDAIHHDFVFQAFCPRYVNHLVGKGLIISPFDSDSNSWVNQAYAEYYGAGSVRETPCPGKEKS